MRRLRVLKDLLTLPAAAVMVVIAVLGNLKIVGSVFPQARPVIDALMGNGLLTGLVGWLSQNGFPNWLSVLLVVVSIALFEGAYRRLGATYWPKPSIILTPSVETRGAPGGAAMSASLVASNQEDQEISECTATLVTATHLYGAQMTPVTTIRNNRLRWKESQLSSDDCKITLPPKSGSRSIAVVDAANGFQFAACKPSASDRGLIGLYRVSIRVDGKHRGRDLEPHFFDGYLYLGNPRSSQQLTMILEEGDWKKDKRLPKPNRSK